MADIQNEILSKYGIDITQDNIFKLYKLDSADISPQELENKIQETRKRWNSSINGANEKNAERDKARLEKADRFEAILKDDKIRHKVFDFYSDPSDASKSGAVPGGNSTKFAKEYFELVATTKKIKNSDLDFYCDYFKSEKKNRTAIAEMLSKEMNVMGLRGKSKKNDDDESEESLAEETKAEKKKKSDLIIANLFDRDTIITLHNAILMFGEASESSAVCRKFPNIKNGIYDFLEIKENGEDAKCFFENLDLKSKEVYKIQQENGRDFAPLVKMFTTLKLLENHKDVINNIPEFKLLIKYPNLTPYMYSFVEVKPKTIKEMVYIANREYSFRDETDFILNYYNLIHDNFNISNNGIKLLLRDANKKAKQNKILNAIDSKLGINSHKKKLPFGAQIIHWLSYWPIFIVYFVFEIAKNIFKYFHLLSIPVFAFLFVLGNIFIPKTWDVENLLVLLKIFSKNQWVSFLGRFAEGPIENVVEAILLSLVAIVTLLAIYVIPPLFFSLFVSRFADSINKQFDWIGIERTFKHIIDTLRTKTENQYFSQKKQYFDKMSSKVLINIVCPLFIVAVVFFAIEVLPLLL